MRRHFYSITARAGIPTWPQNDGTKVLRLHDLRHACGTLLISLGVKPKLVQTLLRHSRLATTMDLSFTLAPKPCRDPPRISGGLCWIRTSDLCDVNAAL